MPNENEIQTVVETPELTPAEMFLRDLEGEVSSPSVEEPVTVEQTTEIVPEEPKSPTEELVPPMEYQQQTVTMDDINQAKYDILSQIIEMAKEEEPEETVVEEKPIEEELNEEEFLDQYYSNPLPAIKGLADKIANQKVQSELAGLKKELEPILAQSRDIKAQNEIKSVINDFVQQVSDSENYLDDIANYLKSNNLPLNDINSYNKAYANSKIARQAAEIESLKANSNNAKTLDDYLGDAESVGKILSNPGIKEKIIAQYLNELQHGGKPATISSGGASIGSDPVKPGTFDEAGSFLLRDLQR